MEKTIEVIATIWVNTNSDRPPTILKSRPLVRCKDCVYSRPWREGYVNCANWLGGVREDGYCHFAEEKK